MNESWAEQLRMFPSFTERDAIWLTKLLRQYKANYGIIFSTSLPPQLRQGDIFTDIPFNVFLQNDRKAEFRTYGMVISCSCDFEQREHVLLAPADEISFYEQAYSSDPEAEKSRKITDLRENIVFETFHVPAYTNNPELVFDLSRINSYEVNLIKENLSANKIKRIASLSDIGYKFLLMKLTAFLLRPEDPKAISRQSLLN